MKKNKEMVMLEETIRKNAFRLTTEAVDGLTANHISSNHVKIDRSEVIRRAQMHARDGKHEKEEAMASAFFSMNELGIALDLLANDDYLVATVAKVAASDVTGKKEFDVFGDDYLGYVAKPNGAIVETSVVRFMLDFHGSNYRNRATGMPFDIATAFLVPEED